MQREKRFYFVPAYVHIVVILKGCSEDFSKDNDGEEGVFCPEKY